jgi:creatinine amidohydrolase/Fe(II)-dependent formamide hydrolase-like protein
MELVISLSEQVKWALEIRAKVVAQHGGKTDAQKIAFEELTNRIKSAKWWIEHRNLQSKQPFSSISVEESVEDFIKNQLGLSDGEF